MVFSSLQFIFVFMPIFFGIYYFMPNTLKNIVILIGSLCFYFVGTKEQPEYVLLFLINICVDYFIGRGMENSPKQKKQLLMIGILFHVICLLIFKYLGFMMSEMTKIFPNFPIAMQLVLPIGISFYTFQGISYLCDVYKGRIKAEKSFIRYAVFLSMFEQLIAGPIVTYQQVQNELHCKKLNLSRVLNGVGTFIIGLGLKVLLANPMGKLWIQTCAIGFESISTPLAWMAIIAFTFQIYFDFWGYSLMAIGLGRMLGFELPKNFDAPYLSYTMTEFWRRWHITLGSWFKEYVYIPLGGNRNGTRKTIRNLLLLWLLTGIWHGAGYHFILWGFVLFMILITEKYVIGAYLQQHKIVGRIYMMVLIPLTWAIFAIEDMGQLGIFFTRLFPFFDQGPWSVFRYDYWKYLQLYYPFFIAGILCCTKIPFQILQKIQNKWVITMVLTLIFVVCVYCMYRGLNDPFLYFRF